MGVILLLGALGLSSGGCSASPAHPTIEVTVTRGSDSVVVEGTTDLPDGVVLEVSAWPNCPGTLSDADGQDFTEAVVMHGAFQSAVHPQAAAGSPISVKVMFVPASQSGDVLERYGTNGERMSGDGVYEDIGHKVYAVSVCS